MNEPQEFLKKAVMVKRLFERNYEREFKGRKITGLQALMLHEISSSEGLKAIDLSRRMGYNKSLVTKNLKDLSKAGYIVITPVDGRTISIALSDSGREILRKSDFFGERFVNKTFSKCSEEDIDRFYEILDKLVIE